MTTAEKLYGTMASIYSVLSDDNPHKENIKRMMKELEAEIEGNNDK